MIGQSSKVNEESEQTKRGESTNDDQVTFVYLADGSRHSIGITVEGIAYSWGRSNALGQLGRSTTNTTPNKVPGQVTSLLPNKAYKAYVSQGSSADSGHSAVLDKSGVLWMAGCDRWQQLGLGSSKAGSTGYTWKGGKMWQEKFIKSIHITDLMSERQEANENISILDVALGGDHTLVLASNRRDVYAFGKGGDGQLGLIGKPFVSAPVQSKILSEPGIAAVCAFKACSITLDEHGSVKQQVGKCRSASEGLLKCVARAKRDGLIVNEELSKS